jgi:hypothetical protein
MTPLDTAPKAAAIQTEVLRRLTPVRRLSLAIEMSEFARGLTLARLKTQFPQVPDRELRLRLALQYKK